MHLLAPAKINLHLRVGPPRPADGFHPIVSWMCTVGLFDTLEIEARGDSTFAPGDGSEIVSLTCDDPTMPCDGTNLVVRAANALMNLEGIAGRAAHPTRLSRVAAHLKKSIPSGAGLGGGSSDAAAMLRGLARLWKLDVPAQTLSEVSARVGSDVPFFLLSGGSRGGGGDTERTGSTGSGACTGRGEIVENLPRPRGLWALLLLPPLHLPTPKVYRRFDELKLGKAENLSPAPDFASWTQLSAEELLPRLVNDLEGAAFDIEPKLGALRAEAERRLSRPVRMSGSGSSLFTLYNAEAETVRASGDVRPLGARVEVVKLAPEYHDDASL